MTSDQFKWVAIVLIFVSGVAGGMLPWLLKKNARFDLWFSLGNSFAGGVFLGIGLIHMLSSAADVFSEKMPNMSYPMVYLLAGITFMLFLLIERILPKHDFDEVQLSVDGSKEPSRLSAYLLLLILSVHSFLAGFALGIEATIAGAVVILIALLAHKSVAAFALGISFFRTATSFIQHLFYILLFSLSTPVGVIAGMLFDEWISASRRGAAEGVFYAMAGGTFLYIATLDIFSEEFLRPTYRQRKFLASTLGFALMALVAVWL
ncbi:MAG: ZIP family metal transporter [Verrucomicrobiota bacterium]